MAKPNPQPSGKKDTSYRAQRFWEQQVEHANKKGRSGIPLHELQIGFQGYLRAIDRKVKKHQQAPEPGKPT